MSIAYERLTCELMLTSACNMRCTYCIASGLNYGTMGVETGQKAIDMFVSMSTGAKLLEFVFTGGEPLLDFSSLKHLALYARNEADNAEIETSLLLKTNGLLLNQEMIDFIIRSNIKVIVSIDGTAAVHNKYRKSSNKEGTHHVVANNIESLLLHGVSCVASYTIHPSESRSILVNVRYLYELGVRNIDIGPAYGSVIWNNRNIIDLIRSLRDIANFVREIRELGGILEIGPIYQESEHVGGILSDHWGCGAGLDKLAFLPNGQIAGCSSLAMLTPSFPELIIGDVNVGLDNLSLCSLQQKSQATIDDRYSCQRCETAANCAGGCLAINYAVSGSPFSPPPFYCKTIHAISNAWGIAWG